MTENYNFIVSSGDTRIIATKKVHYPLFKGEEVFDNLEDAFNSALQYATFIADVQVICEEAYIFEKQLDELHLKEVEKHRKTI